MLVNALPEEPSNEYVEWLGNATKPSFSLDVDYASPSFGIAVTVGDYEPVETSADYAWGAITISPAISPVPEPQTLSLLLVGLLCLIVCPRPKLEPN